MPAGEGKALARGAKLLTRPIEDAVGKADRLVIEDGAKAGEHAAAGSADKTLTAADRKALADYSGPKFRNVNRFFRSGGSGFTKADAKAQEKFGSQISTALDKLPDHEGTVYRGVGGGRNPMSDDEAKAIADNYRKGETVTEKAFTSSSLRAPGSKGGGAFGGKVQFVIDSAHGKSIQDYVLPKFAHQQEVLFDKGTSFEVLDIRLSNGVHQIFLKEVR